MKTARDTKRQERRAQRGARRSRSPATPTPASPRCSTGSPAPACWSRTRCSPPSTRPCAGPRPPDGRAYTLTDTVGFVRHLPHQLVEAFRSTLEEVADADLILHVVDGSDADPEAQLAAVREVLADVDAQDVPELVVDQQGRPRRPAGGRPAAPPRAALRRRLRPHRRRDRRAAQLDRPRAAAAVGAGRRAACPTTAGDLVSRMHDEGELLEQDHLAEGTRVRALVTPALAAELAPYAVSPATPADAAASRRRRPRAYAGAVGARLPRSVTADADAPRRRRRSPRVRELLAAAVAGVGGTERPGQVQMAEAVAAAMTDGSHLLVQAGTGTGKSLAYLVPALLHDDRVVVATATIALQNQVVDRDLPPLVDAVEPLLGRRPTYAILKGRSNYLCRNKVHGGMPDDDGDALFDPSPTTALGRDVVRLRAWAEDTETGDRDELDPGVDRPGLAAGQRHRARVPGRRQVPLRRRVLRRAGPRPGRRGRDRGDQPRAARHRRARGASRAARARRRRRRRGARAGRPGHRRRDRRADRRPWSSGPRPGPGGSSTAPRTSTDAAVALEAALAGAARGAARRPARAARHRDWRWCATPRATWSREHRPGQAGRRRRPQGGRARLVDAVHETAERVAAHSPYDVTWIVARPAPRLGAAGSRRCRSTGCCARRCSASGRWC